MKKYLIFFALLLFCGCTREQKRTKPLVVTSIPPYAHIAEEIGDNAIDVVSFLSPEDNPHTFEPTPKQMDAIKHAKLFIGIGEPYEARLIAALRQNNINLHVLNLTKTVPLSDSDRHIWMSPKLMKPQVDAMATAINLIASSGDIKNNAEDVKNELRDLDQHITEELKDFQNQALLVSHPSFGYYCHDYGLVQVPVEYEGKAPLPRQLGVILQMEKTTPFRCAFVIPQDSEKGTRIIAERISIPVYSFNPLAEDYFENMKKLTKLIARGP